MTPENNLCPKCKNTGWFRSDDVHHQVCDECCDHGNNWLLWEGGIHICLEGCGQEFEKMPQEYQDNFLKGIFTKVRGKVIS